MLCLHISHALSITLCSLLCTRTGGGQADKSQSDTFSPAAIICSQILQLEKHLYSYLCVYLDHNISMYIFVWLHYSQEIYTLPLNSCTQRWLRFAHHTKDAIPVNFIKSCLGNLYPFSQLLPFSLSWLSVIHLKA